MQLPQQVLLLQVFLLVQLPQQALLLQVFLLVQLPQQTQMNLPQILPLLQLHHQLQMESHHLKNDFPMTLVVEPWYLKYLAPNHALLL